MTSCKRKTNFQLRQNDSRTIQRIERNRMKYCWKRRKKSKKKFPICFHSDFDDSHSQRHFKITSKDTRARFERNGAVEEKQLWKERSDSITIDFFTQSEVEELRRKQEELEGTV